MLYGLVSDSNHLALPTFIVTFTVVLLGTLELLQVECLQRVLALASFSPCFM